MGLNIPRPVGGQRVEVINPNIRPVYVAFVNAADGQLLQISDGSLAVIDHVHAEVHEGNLFKFHYLATVNSGINIDVLMVTPNQPFEWHFDGVVSSSAGATVYLYENVITTNDGVGITVFNANRQSPKTNTMIPYVGPTITNLGMQIDGAYLGAGNVLGGVARGEEEWIYQANYKYLLRTTSNGNNNRISVRLNWYEES